MRTNLNSPWIWQQIRANRISQECYTIAAIVYTNAGSSVRKSTCSPETSNISLFFSCPLYWFKTMNNFVRVALRSSSLRALTMPLNQRFGVQNAAFTRSLWHMSKTPPTIKYLEKDSIGCKCGCGARFAHTDGNYSQSFSVKFRVHYTRTERARSNITSINQQIIFDFIICVAQARRNWWTSCRKKLPPKSKSKAKWNCRHKSTVSKWNSMVPKLNWQSKPLTKRE